MSKIILSFQDDCNYLIESTLSREELRDAFIKTRDYLIELWVNDRSYDMILDVLEKSCTVEVHETLYFSIDI